MRRLATILRRAADRLDPPSERVDITYFGSTPSNFKAYIGGEATK